MASVSVIISPVLPSPHLCLHSFPVSSKPLGSPSRGTQSLWVFGSPPMFIYYTQPVSPGAELQFHLPQWALTFPPFFADLLLSPVSGLLVPDGLVTLPLPFCPLCPPFTFLKDGFYSVPFLLEMAPCYPYSRTPCLFAQFYLLLLLSTNTLSGSTSPLLVVPLYNKKK